MVFINTGDVDIIVKEDGASCTNPCTSFVCTANQTNILRIFQDGIRCISFQRNVDTHHNTCPGLSIEEKIADPDPTNEALSTFAVQAKQCFDGETNMVNIECVDAKLSSKALNITSDTCEVKNFTCHEFNCSGCIKRNMGINKWCKDLENFTNQIVDVRGEQIIRLEPKYCQCEENVTESVVLTGQNKCGEKTIIIIAASCEDVTEKVRDDSESGSDGTIGITIAVVGVVSVLFVVLILSVLLIRRKWNTLKLKN
jgi:hypothetical protein